MMAAMEKLVIFITDFPVFEVWVSAGVGLWLGLFERPSDTMSEGRIWRPEPFLCPVTIGSFNEVGAMDKFGDIILLYKQEKEVF